MKKFILISSLLAAGTLGAWASTTITDLTTSTTGTVSYTAPTSGSSTGTITSTDRSNISTAPGNSRYLISTTVNIDLSKAVSTDTQILNYTATGNSSSGAIGLMLLAGETTSGSTTTSTDNQVVLTWAGGSRLSNSGSFDLTNYSYNFNGNTYALVTLVSTQNATPASALYTETASTALTDDGLKGSAQFSEIHVNTDYVTSLTTQAGAMTTAEILANSMSLKYAWQWADGTAEWTDVGTHFTNPVTGATAQKFVSGESVEFTGADASSENTVTITTAKTIDTLKVMQGAWTFSAGDVAVTSDTIYVASGATFALDSTTTNFTTDSILGAGTISLAEGSKLTATGTVSAGTLTGAGTLAVSATETFSMTISDTWTGTIDLGTVGTVSSPDFNIDAYGNANSTVAFSGFSGLLSAWNAGTVSTNLHLTNGTTGYAMKFTQGGSSVTVTFSGTITGDGNILSEPFGQNAGVSLLFSGDLSGFSGSIKTDPDSSFTVGNVGPLIFGSGASATNGNVAGTGDIYWIGNKTISNTTGVVFNYSATSVAGATAVTVGNASITANQLTFQGGANYEVSSNLVGTGTAPTLTIAAGTTTTKGSISDFTVSVAEGAALDIAGTGTLSALTIENAGTVTISGTATVAGSSSLAISTGTVSVANGGTLDLSGATLTIAEGASLANSGTLVVDSDTRITLSHYEVGTLIYSGAGTVSGDITATTLGLRGATFMSDANGLSIASITGADLVWNATNGNWNTTASNWTNNGTNDTFYLNDNVTFSGTATGTITLTEEIVAGTVNVTASNTTTFQQAGFTLSIDTLNVGDGTSGSNLQLGGLTSSGASGASGTLLVNTINVKKDSTLTIVNSVGSAGDTTTGAGSGKTIGAVTLDSGARLTVFDYNYSTTSGNYQAMATKIDSVTVAGDSTIGVGAHYGAMVEVKNLFLADGVDSATLTATANHSANNFSLFSFGDTDGTSSATGTAFAGTLAVEVASTGKNRHTAVQINNETILAGAVIDFASVSVGKNNDGTKTEVALALNGNVTIAGLKDELTDTQLENCNLTVFSGTIDTGANNTGTNMFAYADSANTLTINTAADQSYEFAGDITGVALVKDGAGTQTLTGNITDHSATVKSSLEVKAGTLNLSGTNSYTGTTTVTNATLNISAGTTTLSGTTTITAEDSQESHLYVLNGATLVQTSAGNAEGLGITLSGTNANLEVQSGGTLEVASTSGNRWGLDFASVKLTTGSKLKFSTTANSADFIFAANQSFTGTTIEVGENAVLSNYGSLSLGMCTITGDGTFKVNGDNSGVVYLIGATVDVANFAWDSTKTAGTLNVSGNTTISSNMSSFGANMTLAANSTLTISSTIGSESTKAASVTFVAGAKLVLTDDWLKTLDVADGDESVVLKIICSEAITVTDSTGATTTISSENASLMADYVTLGSMFSDYALQTWSYANDTLSLTLAIPEPSMFGLLAGTLALALAGTRRRRRGNAK